MLFPRFLFWLIFVPSLLAAATGGGQDRGEHIRQDSVRLGHFARGEAAKAAEKDSVARIAYLLSTRDAHGKEIPDSLTGLALHHIATMYMNAWQDTLAMPFFRRSLAIRDSIFHGPHNQRAHIRTNMGMSMLYYGKPDSAAILIQEANAIYESVDHPDSLYWLQSLNELGDQAIRSDDYGLAYSSSYRAVELCEQLSDLDGADKFATYYRATRILFHFYDFEAALGYGHLALQALEPDAIENRALCMNLIALIDRQLGNHDRSYRLLRESLRLTGAQPDEYVLARANALLYLAEHYAMTGDVGRSRYYDGLARTAYAEFNALSTYHSRFQLAMYAFRDKQYTIAEDRLNRSLHFLRAQKEGSSSGNIVQIAQRLLLRARVYAAKDDPDRALTDLHEAFGLQDKLRSEFTDPTSQRFLSGDLRKEIDLAVELHYRLYVAEGDDRQLWEAFRLSERARAFSLLVSMGKRVNSREESTIKGAIAKLERQVARGDSAHQSKLEALRIRLAGMQRANHPDARGVEPLDSTRLIGYLDRHSTQLLEYHLADSLQLAFLLSPDGTLRAFPLPVDTSLLQEIAEWNKSIVKSAYRRKSLRPKPEQDSLDRVFWARGWGLTRQVMPEELRTALDPELALCIVPDSALNYLPFVALPVEEPSAGPIDYGAMSYFQDSHAVSYAYSGAYLTRVEMQPARAYPVNLMAFAPGFGKVGPLAAARSGREGEPLSALNFNQEEARTIAGMLPGSEVYCDSMASRARFLASVGQSRILHLSTHGLVDPQHPELSFVAFNQPAGRLDEDELLYFNDLYNLPIDNELTVLSACETSLGQLARGEAPLSFAAAFASAGARSTLTTLWEVDDRATRDFMIAFYQELNRGRGRLTSLVSAQQALRSTDYFHPYYWAAPSLYGLTGTIDSAAPALAAGIGRRWSWLALTGFALVVLLSYFYKRT
ncbi:CHAT domain-containing protein [Neolewinella xylanilytica]|uniref:CHAT domain-containing protein n=1 Tax=Neolewinella xylanilytica TaxID=1514080 RepID=A0A2S6I7N7_9BACT|nr:CHAT domain-containing protein [Neolewinella xylanilytica]PPK87507.1 CHAT domain-containing protein [Neolewinella xylanilytica]